MTSPLHDLRLFVLEPNHGFGERVAESLGMEPSAHEEREFEDGEHKARPLTSVRDANVFVLDSLYSDSRRSVNDKLCRLLFFAAACRDHGAARVTVVAPYLCYGRKDRRTKSRDPVTTRYVAQLLEAVGADAVLTMDPHNPAAWENAFRGRSELLEARTIFIDHFGKTLSGRKVAVLSPDVGGVKRAEAFRKDLSTRLGASVASGFMEKERSGGVVSGDTLVGHVEGRVVLLVDDMIVTGTTMARAAHACLDAGATDCYAVGTHGLFLEGALEVVRDEALAAVVVTDTIPSFRLPPDLRSLKLTVVGAAPLFAEAIRRLHTGGSLAELLEAE